VKGAKLVRVGRREYETADKRFHAMWHARQGARSSYTVLDRKTGRTLRARRVDELRETIRDMLKDDAP
jgi:hypothetical protein